MEGEMTWVRILTLLLADFVTLGKIPPTSESQLLICQIWLIAMPASLMKSPSLPRVYVSVITPGKE